MNQETAAEVDAYVAAPVTFRRRTEKLRIVRALSEADAPAPGVSDTSCVSKSAEVWRGLTRLVPGYFQQRFPAH